MKNKLTISIFLAALTFLFLIIMTPSYSGATTSDIHYSQNKNIADKVFTLQGVGKKTVFFMSAFEVGFYQDNDRLDLKPLDNVAKHLEVRYFVNIPGKKLFNYNIEVMKNNYSEEDLLDIANEISELREYYVDLKKGDCYELTYIPEIGTSFKLNGQLKGTIKGERFAEILFAVWLGEKPFDKKIKEQILSLRDSSIEEKLSFNQTEYYKRENYDRQTRNIRTI